MYRCCLIGFSTISSIKRVFLSLILTLLKIEMRCIKPTNKKINYRKGHGSQGSRDAQSYIDRSMMQSKPQSEYQSVLTKGSSLQTLTIYPSTFALFLLTISSILSCCFRLSSIYSLINRPLRFEIQPLQS